MNYKDYTKEEFLKEHDGDCPDSVGLKVLPNCHNGDFEEECSKCWNDAIKDIDFKNVVDIFAEKNMTILDDLRIVEEQYNVLKEGRDKLKEELLKQMESHGVEKFENENMSITYVKGGTTSKFDSVKFKKEYPDTYKEYSAESKRAASIRFKVKK